MTVNALDDYALLVLEDGVAFVGKSAGKRGESFGEIVFSTGMTGYQETITDPSYFGQIVVQTFPHIGNTGVNSLDKESEKVWVSGYVVREFSEMHSSWRAEEGLEDLLKRDNVTAISNIDTRFLTKHLRSKGVMKAGIFSGDSLAAYQNLLGSVAIGDRIDAPNSLLQSVQNASEMKGAHLAQNVSVSSERVLSGDVSAEYGVGHELLGLGASGSDSLSKAEHSGQLKVAVVDLGVKEMTLKLLQARGIQVHVLPIDVSFEQIRDLNPDGVFFSNGPGDPSTAVHEIELLRKVLAAGIPFFGICMGNQMLGRALGFDTYKLKFGHRGINQPVKDLRTGRVEITAHNHGFAVDIPLGDLDEFGYASNPPKVLTPYNGGQFGHARVSHIGLNDNVVEGIECLDIPAFSVQYHPEAAAGPHDAAYLFDRFVELMQSFGADGATSAQQNATSTSSTTAESASTIGVALEQSSAIISPSPQSDYSTSCESDVQVTQANVQKVDRVKPQSVLVIGSGPIVIGQACEFDYSGTQACRVLKEEGVRVILVNSNPATIMTDPDFADATYIEPITTPALERIIAKERPEAILPTLGGQTALNAAISLSEEGVLEKYNVRLIGANLEAIRKGEDRDEFKKVVERAGGESANSYIAHSMQECKQGVEELGGYPVVVRPSFTMGGLGSGIAFNEEDLERIAGAGLHYSPTSQVLLEESILGWKEYELEMMRDSSDNVVVVCTIENFDPVGVHTGDSITVAPALTLTDREYQKLRDISINIIREVGVDTGGCNIQFALNPENGRIIVIEMNPRVSRSSALASKATGFPIAKIATKLACGYQLDEIKNDITKETPSSFEPTLDYVVVKIPRFAFEKFPAADDTLTTTMKSVGEAMAIGRNFAESLQKACRSIDKGITEFAWSKILGEDEISALIEEIKRPTASRLLQVQTLLHSITKRYSQKEAIYRVFEATKIDPWFLDQICQINAIADSIVDTKEAILKKGTTTRRMLKTAKSNGFSDKQIASLLGLQGSDGENFVRELRLSMDVLPVYKTVDTCAAEFEAKTPYYYSSYDFDSEVLPRSKDAIIILGSGPNRIGQGIEFDYSCVHAALELSKDFETIMINCNPETVSTDYDTSDRLYFEPLTFEDVMSIIDAESKAGKVHGVIVQLGGQTPLSLAARLKDAGVNIIGTTPEAIDSAEDREEFGNVLKRAGLKAPKFGTARTSAEAIEIAESIDYPVLVRPSYVLGGRGMEIVYSRDQLELYVAKALEEAKIQAHDRATLPSPLLIDKFLADAMEIDVDAIFDGEELYLGGVMEHIEEAGIHSGDSACVLPPATLSRAQIDQIREATRKIAAGVGVQGLINVQFALAGSVLYVIEANPRASRTVPFVSKATGTQLAKAAVRVMLGESIASLRKRGYLKPTGDGADFAPGTRIAVKEAVLPFKRFRTKEGLVVDSLLGPEMRSTGEVMGFDIDFPHAFAKAQEAVLGRPNDVTGGVFLSIADKDKKMLPVIARIIDDIGFKIYATAGTKDVLDRNGISSCLVSKISGKFGGVIEDEVTAVDLIEQGKVHMIINTPSGQASRSDGYEIRAAATAADVPVVTTIQHFVAAAEALRAAQSGHYLVSSLQEYHAS